MIEAFKSTLGEARYADIIIHVVDSSSPQMERQMQVVYETLKQLGVEEKTVITLFNKQDMVSEEKIFRDSRADYVLKISAKYHEGLESLRALLEGDFKKDSRYLSTGFTDTRKLPRLR